MAIISHTYNITINLPASEELAQLKQFMAENFDQLKQKIEAQAAQLDTIQTGITGVAGDIAALKEQLGNLANGATAEQIAELTTLVDGTGTRLNDLGTQLTDLDAQTPPPTQP